MPAIVTAEPLSVHFQFPNSTTWIARLGGLPNAQLAGDLAQGLPHLTHPLGGIATRRRASHYVTTLRRMVHELADAGFTGGATDLTRPLLIRYWLAATATREALTRGLLAGFDSATGLLAEDVRAHLQGRALKTRTAYKPRAPYTEREWSTLMDRCQTIVDTAREAQRAMLRAAERGTDPRHAGLSEENLAWLLVNYGPHTRADVAQRTGEGRVPIGVAGLGRVARALFPTTDVVLAYVLLFGTYTGIVPDGIAELGLADIDWAGDTTVLLDYVKGRSGRESLNLPSSGVRLLQRWLDHSELLRGFAPAELRPHLWIRVGKGLGRARPGEHALVGPLRINHVLIKRWVAEHDVAIDGVPIPIHRGRIRTTYQNLLSRRGWTGRTTIDPNHSPEVEGDHYLTAATPAQLDAIEAIVEDGQADLLRKARPAIVLSDQQAADAASAFPRLVAEHGLDQDAITKLIGGERDVFVAACANQLASPYGPAGKPCPARPWVCLLCPLAVFLPRHLPNLLRLKGFFSRQFRQQPTAAFMAVFGPYAHRLETEVLTRFQPSLIVAATAQIDADTDPGRHLPLRPEEHA